MLIDAHAHLDHYQEPLAAALEEIGHYPVFTISNSMDVASYRRNLEIADRCEWVLPTFGVHPWNAAEYSGRLDELSPWIADSLLLGEIGLDFHWIEDADLYPAQRQVFAFFLEWAQRQEKIVNLHTKGAEAETLAWLERYHIQRAIVHWYSGPLDIFREMVRRGYLFTVGVEISYSTHIQSLVRELPMSQLLTETDNPGGLEWLTGTIGMPHHLEDIVPVIADLKRTTPEAVREDVRQNFLRLIEQDRHVPERYRTLLTG